MASALLDNFARDVTPLTVYTQGQSGGVMLLVVAGIISILAVACATVYYFAFTKRTKTFHKTNIAPYLVSLLLANVLQAIATILNARWVSLGFVFDGRFCAFQGGLKNAANVGTALWSFVIAAHVFNLLFLRWRTTRRSMYATLVGGWCAVVMIVTIGPTIIETPEKGPYFGVSGYWCWITSAYPEEQTFLEYFFEFLSAGLGFVLYALILLRVRGNLTAIGGRWYLRWIPRSQAWQLSVGRDILDSAMLRVAANMVWYPVAYSLIIVPVALARLSSFTGHHVPFWATITTDVIFNLTGLVNSILLVTTRNVLPDTTSLPQFTTPRKQLDVSESDSGVTPFTFSDTSSSSSRDSILPKHTGDENELDSEKSTDTSCLRLPNANHAPTPALPSMDASSPQRQDSGDTTAAQYGDSGDESLPSGDLGPIVESSRPLYIGPKPISSYPIVHPIGVGSPQPPSAFRGVEAPERKETFASNTAEFGSDDGH